MSDEEKNVLARIERKLDEQAKRDERLITLLAAGLSKKVDQHEKKSPAWLL